MKKSCGIIFQRVFLALGLLGANGGCSLWPARSPAEHAFISYWPPPAGTNPLRLSVKDNIDMKGQVTTAGSAYLARNSRPAMADAPCLAVARQRGVAIIGKTNLSEFAIAPSGINEYFGTPPNPLSRWRKRIPGGSSSGAAVAITSGLADVSFGTDTAGSVRVPAACCGIVGLKTTRGLLPLKGVHPIDAEHLDTIGPLARDCEHAAQGMDLLQRGFSGRFAAERAARSVARSIRVGRLHLNGTDRNIDKAVDDALARTGFQVIPLGDDLREKWEQAQADGNTLAAVGAWKTDRKFLPAIGVSFQTKAIILYGGTIPGNRYREALARQSAWQKALERVFKQVDFIALPTLQSVPPPIPDILKVGTLEREMLTQQNTVAVNFAGNPAVAVPIPLPRGSVARTSLQLIGPRLGEAGLLNAGSMIEGDFLP